MVPTGGINPDAYSFQESGGIVAFMMKRARRDNNSSQQTPDMSYFRVYRTTRRVEMSCLHTRGSTYLLSIAVFAVLATCMAVLLPLASRSPAPTTASSPNTFLEHTAFLPATNPPAPREICSTADLVGAFILADKTSFQIDELVWGIDSEGFIGYAILRATAADGQIIDYENLDAYHHLVTTPDGLRGGRFVDRKGETYTIRELVMGVLRDRHIGPLFQVLEDSNGEQFIYGELDVNGQALLLGRDGVTCCGLHLEASCVPNPTCINGSCPGPTQCSCTGEGSCLLKFGQVCNGLCGKVCMTMSGACNGSIVNCMCVTGATPSHADQ